MVKLIKSSLAANCGEFNPQRLNYNKVEALASLTKRLYLYNFHYRYLIPNLYLLTLSS